MATVVVVVVVVVVSLWVRFDTHTDGGAGALHAAIAAAGADVRTDASLASGEVGGNLARKRANTSSSNNAKTRLSDGAVKSPVVLLQAADDCGGRADTVMAAGTCVRVGETTDAGAIVAAAAGGATTEDADALRFAIRRSTSFK